MKDGVQIERVSVVDVKVDDEILFFPQDEETEILHAGVVTETTIGRDSKERIVSRVKVYSEDQTFTLELVRLSDLVERIVK